MMMSPIDNNIGEDEDAFEIPVRCSYFNSSESYRAMTFRFSRECLYMEAEQPFEEGALIYIRMEVCNSRIFEREGAENLRSASLAEVISCRELPEEKHIRYAITVRYYNPFGY